MSSLEKDKLGLISDSASVEVKLKATLAAIGAPMAITDDVLSLAKAYGLEILTATLGYVGIHLINTGSSRYGELRDDMSEDESTEVVRDASGKVLGGTVALATIALAAGNPLFAIPEFAAVLTSLRPYLDSRFPKISVITKAVRADVGLAVVAVATGTYTISRYAESNWDALPPLGLTALSTAFAIGGQKAYEKLYRLLTIAGGSVMVVGSSQAAYETLQENNAVGAIMASVFLLLNGLFTKNEMKEVLKMKEVL